MNSKKIVALPSNTKLCMKCLKNRAVHTYYLSNRGYGSSFDSWDTKFRCCEECNKEDYKEWFDEENASDGYTEFYPHEDDIWNLVNNLPLESRELFENTFNSRAWRMDAQDWIDYELDELSYEKCREYGVYSNEDTTMYEQRFPTCIYVANVNWDDGSKGAWCPFGSHGEYGPKCGCVSRECMDCSFYQQRGDGQAVKEVQGSDLDDWQLYMHAKIRASELEEKFG